jgi:hypothetical protein
MQKFFILTDPYKYGAPIISVLASVFRVDNTSHLSLSAVFLLNITEDLSLLIEVVGEAVCSLFSAAYLFRFFLSWVRLLFSWIYSSIL